jgi:hypothetical protein
MRLFNVVIVDSAFTEGDLERHLEAAIDDGLLASGSSRALGLTVSAVRCGEADAYTIRLKGALGNNLVTATLHL